MALSPSVMGIVNVTPDSFFPQSRTLATADAVARGRAHFDAGCDIVDVGGESTRPGATIVPVEEEIARVVPVIEELSTYGPVSVDTQKAEVARAAIAAGASVLNDVSSTLVDVAGELGVGYVAMHRQGDSATMQLRPTYDDVVGEIGAFLSEMAERARAAGVAELWLDPGIGFGKTAEHNIALLAHVSHFVGIANQHHAGVLIGTSRKRFLGDFGGEALDVDQRIEGSIATEAWSLLQGVSMVRVHDAAAAVQLRELLVRPVEEVVA
jgi:dihydropteroate synthase